MNNISIILIKPQMGENIGATARAMKNFGIKELRIVSPRDGWPNAKAHEMSANADDIIENAKIYNSTEDATADLNLLFATASKTRDMVKEVIPPAHMADIIFKNDKDTKIGIVFGRESSGLDNEDISYCNYLVSIPVSPDYDSLNLAQAVCIIGYELFKRTKEPENSEIKEKYNKNLSSPLSERQDINEMIKFLEQELTNKKFFQSIDKKPGMLINIRNIFTRHFYTEQEIRTLRGIFNSLKK